jgi:hypothetical protein
MTVKREEFKTVAKGNGVPASGDLFEGIYNGETYRAEFYLDGNFNNPQISLAADSIIEKKTETGWEKVETKNLSDDDFNSLINGIAPVLDIF